MTKSEILLNVLEKRVVNVAWHDPGFFGRDGYYENAHIFYFETWEVPGNDDLVKDLYKARSYISLWKNLRAIEKSEVTKYNFTKRRISYQLEQLKRVFIPKSVWSELGVKYPGGDQIIFLQALYLLQKQHNIGLVTLPTHKAVSLMKRHRGTYE